MVDEEGYSFYITKGLCYFPKDRCPDCEEREIVDPLCLTCNGNGYRPGTRLLTIQEAITRIVGEEYGLS